METETKAKVKTAQFVVNVSESDKAIINSLKDELSVGDKGVIRLLIEIALNNREGVTVEDGVETLVDTFKELAVKFGLVKKEKPAAKVALTPEQKEDLKIEKRIAKLKAELVAVQAAKDGESSEGDELEPLVEIAV